MSLYGKKVKTCDCGGDVILNEGVTLLIYPPLYMGKCNKCKFNGYYDLTKEYHDERRFYARIGEGDRVCSG